MLELAIFLAGTSFGLITASVLQAAGVSAPQPASAGAPPAAVETDPASTAA